MVEARVLETGQPIDVEPYKSGILVKIPEELNHDDLPVIRLDMFEDNALPGK